VHRAEEQDKKDYSRKDKIVYHAFIIPSCAAKQILFSISNLLNFLNLRLCVKKYFGPSAKNKKDISRKGAKNSIEEGERVAAG